MRSEGAGLFSRWQNQGISLVLCLASLVAVSAALAAQQTSKPLPSPEERLQRHYDAARTFQLSGDQEHAAAEYKAFLAGVLSSCANEYAQIGQFADAADLFEGALGIAPDDPDIRLDYAFVRLRQGKLQEARSLAEKAMAKGPPGSKSHALLGQILFAMGDYPGAKEHLEAVVAEAPDFDLGYLLGRTYIKLNDFTRARFLFDEMTTGLGDSARIHLYFGRAYGEGETESLDKAVEEFKQAIARDARFPQAHYFLALAYLNRDGESGFPKAVPELETELKLSPKDARSYYLLGYIAMKQHDLRRAEDLMFQATKLDPQNPDPLIYLGQIYADSNRESQAEATMRKAIALTRDVTRNNYQINRAHYVLGRILLHNGSQSEGEKELNISKELRDRAAHPELAQNQKLPEFAATSSNEPPAAGSPPVSPEDRKKALAYVDHMKPAIADAYNNLGVILAAQQHFGQALEQFRFAGEWNPSLATLDRNLGMAAFYAEKYAEAIPPLTRHLQAQSDDVRVRAALGLSFFMTQNFPRTLATLKPIESEVDRDAGLGYAYAFSLVKTGEYNEGVRRLQALAKANPNSADIHMLLGKAFADQQEFASAMDEYRKSLAINSSQPQTHFLAGLALLRMGSPADAVQEFRTTLRLSPDDAEAKYHLAYALIETQQKQDALTLLQEVIRQNPKYADAFYQLGKLQLERGDIKAAISNLETGTKLSPNSDYIHYQLAMAYRRDARSDDAEREIKLYQALKNRQRGRDAPQAN